MTQFYSRWSEHDQVEQQEEAGEEEGMLLIDKNWYLKFQYQKSKGSNPSKTPVPIPLYGSSLFAPKK